MKISLTISLLLTMICLIAITPAQAKKLHHEKWYQNYQCTALKGKIEFSPKSDSVRIDCELPNYSIEVDFASAKQYEAVGQALYYSFLTGKRAGVWLIVENENDMNHAKRMVRNISGNQLPITVWLQRNRPNTTPTFDLYYQPSPIVKSGDDQFKKLMEFGRNLEKKIIEKQAVEKAQ